MSIDTCIVTGDFNINLISYDHHYPTERFLDNFISNSFLPSIHLPTRITYHTATLIDNIFIFQRKQKNAQTISSGSIYSAISDHLPCFLIIQYPTKIPKPHRPKVRVYNETNKQTFLNQLQQSDWTSVYNTDDTHSKFKIFYDRFTTLHNINFPLQTLSRSKARQKPWLTKELHKMRRTRDKYYIKMTKGKIDKKEYNSYRNETRKKLREAETEYYNKLFDDKQNGMKSMWNHLGKMLNPNKTKNKVSIKRILSGDKNISDDISIAETLNNHFCTIGKNLADKLPKTKTSFKQFLKKPNPTSIFLSKVTPNQVLEIIGHLKTNKSPGIDNIPNSLIKLSAETIVEPLTHIINHSLSKGIFPESLKVAKVVPLYKKGDEALCSNYRPISLLSSFHKIFEKLVKEKVLNFLSKNEILYKYQFGFRKSHSTNLALLEVVETLYANLDVDNYGLGIYLDLQKAFDTVDHNILLSKLSHYGIRGNALNWFETFLKGRKQFTSVNGACSKTSVIGCGVPQGSVLGPLLFLLYVNDIQNAFTSATPKLFADDINIFLFGKDLKGLFSTANTELASLSEWLLANKLTLSIGQDKDTKFTLFANKQPTNLPKLSFQGLEVPFTTTIKYLGVHLDNKLTFKEHITKICEKIKKYVGIFYHVRHLLPRKCLRVLYFSFIYSYLYYCAEVYGNVPNTSIKPLQLIQNRALRALQFKNRYQPINELHTNFSILKVSDMVHYKQSKIIHSLLTGAQRLPNVMKKLIVPTKKVHQHQTRQKNPVYCAKSRRAIGKRLLKCNASQYFNTLPTNITSQETHGEFKKEFFQFILSSYKPSLLNFAI